MPLGETWLEDLRSWEDKYVKFILVIVNLNPIYQDITISITKLLTKHFTFQQTIFKMWCGFSMHSALQLSTRLISRPHVATATVAGSAWLQKWYWTALLLPKWWRHWIEAGDGCTVERAIVYCSSFGTQVGKTIFFNSLKPTFPSINIKIHNFLLENSQSNFYFPLEDILLVGFVNLLLNWHLSSVPALRVMERVSDIHRQDGRGPYQVCKLILTGHSYQLRCDRAIHGPNWGQASLLSSCSHSIGNSEEHRRAQKYSSLTETLGWGRQKWEDF